MSDFRRVIPIPGMVGNCELRERPGEVFCFWREGKEMRPLSEFEDEFVRAALAAAPKTSGDEATKTIRGADIPPVVACPKCKGAGCAWCYSTGKVESPARQEEAPYFGGGVTRAAIPEDLRARGDALSLEAADAITKLRETIIGLRVIWWQKDEGKVGLSIKYKDGCYSSWLVPDDLKLAESPPKMDLPAAPVCWLLTLNGQPEFCEGCMARTREELLADWPEADGYGTVPLFTSTPISRANTHGNGVEP